MSTSKTRRTLRILDDVAPLVYPSLRTKVSLGQFSLPTRSGVGAGCATSFYAIYAGTGRAELERHNGVWRPIGVRGTPPADPGWGMVLE